VPVQVQGSTLTLEVNHFSDTGFATGSPEDVLATEEQALEAIQTNHTPSPAEVSAKRALCPSPGPGGCANEPDLATQTQIVHAYFTSTVLPGLQGGLAD